MPALPTPLDLFRLNLATAHMLAESQMVIAMRLMGMAGLWRVGTRENSRMVSEKLMAGVEAGAAATGALMAGQGPAAVAQAALKPVRRRTASNARRLARRGPKSPL